MRSVGLRTNIIASGYVKGSDGSTFHTSGNVAISRLGTGQFSVTVTFPQPLVDTPVASTPNLVGTCTINNQPVSGHNVVLKRFGTQTLAGSAAGQFIAEFMDATDGTTPLDPGTFTFTISQIGNGANFNSGNP